MKIILTLLIIVVSQVSLAQTDNEIIKIVTEKDSLFWHAYNTCDTSGMGTYCTNDVEFYHDKGGITMGRTNLLHTTSVNICGAGNFRLRREAVNGTFSVYALRENNRVYGAVSTGEHLFYVIEKGKNERLDGLAKFTNVWILDNGEWKMKRILSYDHGPALRKTH